jgi:NADH-quinone oxidoreductase subunit E
VTGSAFQREDRGARRENPATGKRETMADKPEIEAEVKGETQRILEGLKPDEESLITLLQHVQEHFGYLPREAMIEVASAKGVSRSNVFGVASFYNQFRFVPPGKYPVKVCMGTACHIKGGNAILHVWETRLGIHEGEVTEDRLFSLDRVACVGCCAIAPVSVVGEEVHGSMMPTKVNGILLAAEREEGAKSRDP